MKTIDYYNKYADEFTVSTFKVDMESLYQLFLAELPECARILDVGCGSGRDTLAFKTKGYQVDAIDYSEELVQIATQLTGVSVKLQSFYEIDEHEVYDGVWACASLLHCERKRNEYLITSHHPLRETLIAQTGFTELARRGFLQEAYNCAPLTIGGGKKWEPVENGMSQF